MREQKNVHRKILRASVKNLFTGSQIMAVEECILESLTALGTTVVFCEIIIRKFAGTLRLFLKQQNCFEVFPELSASISQWSFMPHCYI